MKRIILFSLLVAGSVAVQAVMKPGEKFQAYEIQNVETGEKYCQVCKYGGKAGKIIAFGKLDDAKFWADLKELEKLHTAYPKLGVFAQITDSTDTKAIREAAQKNGITFPVVVPVTKEWNQIYKVDGSSRVVYYAKQDNEVVWTNVGLDEKSAAELSKKVAKDLKG